MIWLGILARATIGCGVSEREASPPQLSRLGTAPNGLEERVRWVLDRLLDQYGRPTRRVADPLDELVATILSQNTSDANSGRAFAALKKRFPTWDKVLAAPADELAATIRSGGLATIKAARIQQALSAVLAARGALDLSFLAGLPLEEARRWLASLPGVGGKTASCVLLFALGQPALPVDTHVQRVTVRLGLAPERSSPDRIAAMLEAVISPTEVYDLHMSLIRHGRQTCSAGRPRCEACVLASRCPRIGGGSEKPVVKEQR
ncbi:MAG: endonuclease III [Dehalococcoidia bacterium]|nr:MAG: endonuclease III [Dehalococcoidia bacterium]